MNSIEPSSANASSPFQAVSRKLRVGAQAVANVRGIVADASRQRPGVLPERRR